MTGHVPRIHRRRAYLPGAAVQPLSLGYNSTFPLEGIPLRRPLAPTASDRRFVCRLHEVYCMLATLETEELDRWTSTVLPPEVRAEGDDDDTDDTDSDQDDNNDLDEDLDVVDEPAVAPLEQIDDFDEDDFDDDFDDDFEEDLEEDEEDFTSDSASEDDFETP